MNQSYPSETTSLHPPGDFSGLSPEVVLEALESIGIEVDGRLLALNSYENRVYQVWRDDLPPLVAKFYRPNRWTPAQIKEEHAFVEELVLQEIPVVPAMPAEPAAPVSGNVNQVSVNTLHVYRGFYFAVFAKHGGRAPELEQEGTLEWLGRFIGRIHAVGTRKAFVLRPAIDVAQYGEASLDYLLTNNFVAPTLREAYFSVAAQALDGVRHCYSRAGDVASIRLHGDCHCGNVLWTPAGPHFVDFDDSRSGPAIQDLWMLLSGERQSQTQQLAELIAGYEDFQEFDARELYLVEALRTLRLLHYAAWLAKRWRDPAFPIAFPWFNTERYWQERILELREQVALMDEPPLWRN